MRNTMLIKIFILEIVARAMAGCSACRTIPSRDDRAQRAELAARAVPLPTVTPFERDTARRTVYLEWYWFGYKEGILGGGSSFCGNGHPYYDAQFKGHRDGNRDGINAYFKAMTPPAPE